MESRIRVVVRALIGDTQRLVVCWDKKHQFYFLPGGALEPGEHLQACLVRELQEEMSFKAQIEGFVGCIENHWQGHDYFFQEFNFIFRVQTPPALLQGPVTSAEAHIGFEVMALQDLLKLNNVLPKPLKPFLEQHYNKHSIYMLAP